MLTLDPGIAVGVASMLLGVSNKLSEAERLVRLQARLARLSFRPCFPVLARACFRCLERANSGW